MTTVRPWEKVLYMIIKLITTFKNNYSRNESNWWRVMWRNILIKEAVVLSGSDWCWIVALKHNKYTIIEQSLDRFENYTNRSTTLFFFEKPQPSKHTKRKITTAPESPIFMVEDAVKRFWSGYDEVFFWYFHDNQGVERKYQ